MVLEQKIDNVFYLTDAAPTVRHLELKFAPPLRENLSSPPLKFN